MASYLMKAEVRDLTNERKYFHSVKVEEVGSSNFYFPEDKVLPSSFSDSKLQRSEDGNTIVYTPQLDNHFLCYTTLRFVLPAVRVKSNFDSTHQVCWTHNLCNNSFKASTLMINGEQYQELDSTTSDIYLNAGPEQFNNIQRCSSGITDALELWTTSLPSRKLNALQPWFYSLDMKKCSTAMPLFYLRESKDMQHRYEFVDNIYKLLRVRVKEGDQWKELLYEEIMSRNCLDIDGSTKLIPEMYGRYGMISQGELDSYKCIDKKVFPFKTLINPVTSDANINPMVEGQSRVKIFETKSEYHVVAGFFVAKNEKAATTNYPSNYTNDTSDCYSGNTPIESVKMVCTRSTSRQHERFNLEADQLWLPQLQYLCRDIPNEEGYLSYSFAHNAWSCLSDSGIIFGPADSIAITLTDVRKQPSRITSNFDNTWILAVRLLVVNSFNVVKTKDGKFNISLGLTQKIQESEDS